MSIHIRFICASCHRTVSVWLSAADLKRGLVKCAKCGELSPDAGKYQEALEETEKPDKFAACLTVCEPWATALVAGVKPIENRPMNLNWRGELAIQAGKSLDWFTEEACAQLHAVWPAFPINRVSALNKLQGNLGKIVGTIDLQGWYPVDELLAKGFTAERHFAWGPWCGVQDIAKARRLVTPVPQRGSQGLFKIKRELLAGPYLEKKAKA